MCGCRCLTDEAAGEGAGRALCAMRDARRRLAIIVISELEPMLAEFLLLQLRVMTHVSAFKASQAGQ